MNITHTNNALTFLLTLSFALLGVSFALGANPNTLSATFSFYELDTLLSNTQTSVAIKNIVKYFKRTKVFSKKRSFELISPKRK